MCKVWLITGCSRGLGRELAQAVLAAGQRLVATARDLRDLDVLLPSDRLRIAPLDVTDIAHPIAPDYEATVGAVL
jgi:NAD(P)-dependent dehydrogenase (short-subunit alcohol dehydrogenase family)